MNVQDGRPGPANEPAAEDAHKAGEANQPDPGLFQNLQRGFLKVLGLYELAGDSLAGRPLQGLCVSDVAQDGNDLRLPEALVGGVYEGLKVRPAAGSENRDPHSPLCSMTTCSPPVGRSSTRPTR